MWKKRENEKSFLVDFSNCYKCAKSIELPLAFIYFLESLKISINSM